MDMGDGAAQLVGGSLGAGGYIQCGLMSAPAPVADPEAGHSIA